MKRTILLFILCVCCLGTVETMAQITTGTPTARKIKTGNRPEEGNFGVYLGASTEMFKSLTDGDIKFKALPLVNFKYMYTDDIEFRVGLEFWKKREKNKGETFTESLKEEGADFKTTNLESRNYFYPGVAYHFSPTNLLDIYVGGELPIGWERYKVASSGEYDKMKYEESVSRGTFNIGLGAFIGIQAFIANLPLSIGVEYGLSSMLYSGLKYKHTSKEGKEKEQVYYTKTLDNDAELYNDLKVKQGEIGSQFRFTLTYYFK